MKTLDEALDARRKVTPGSLEAAQKFVGLIEEVSQNDSVILLARQVFRMALAEAETCEIPHTEFLVYLVVQGIAQGVCIGIDMEKSE